MKVLLLIGLLSSVGAEPSASTATSDMADSSFSSSLSPVELRIVTERSDEDRSGAALPYATSYTFSKESSQGEKSRPADVTFNVETDPPVHSSSFGATTKVNVDTDKQSVDVFSDSHSTSSFASAVKASTEVMIPSSDDKKFESNEGTFKTDVSPTEAIRAEQMPTPAAVASGSVNSSMSAESGETEAQLLTKAESLTPTTRHSEEISPTTVSPVTNSNQNAKNTEPTITRPSTTTSYKTTVNTNTSKQSTKKPGNFGPLLHANAFLVCLSIILKYQQFIF